MGLTQIPVLSKRVNVATEAIDNLQDGRVELLSSCESIKPGSQRVAVPLYDNTHEKITLKKGTIVAKVAAANVIPPMLAPASGTFPKRTQLWCWIGWERMQKWVCTTQWRGHLPPTTKAGTYPREIR